jgi:mono/diheme cytochrome c family protein
MAHGFLAIYGTSLWLINPHGTDLSQYPRQNRSPQCLAGHRRRLVFQLQTLKGITMVEFSMLGLSARAGGLVAALLLSGCAVEIENRQPAQAMAQESQPPGSVYTGWRVFQDRCAACHGPGALGGSGIPNLLPLVGNMGSRQFVSTVLMRYDWGIAPEIAKGERAAQAGLVESIVQRRQALITMPAWQGEPVVTAHIMDLFAYLSARANGSQDAGRPP